MFDYVRKTSWYTPDLSLYYDIMLLLGKNKLIQKAEELLQPDTRAYTELIGAYFRAAMGQKAMETEGLTLCTR